MLTNSILADDQYKYIGNNPQLACWEVGKGDQVIIVIHGGPGLDHSYLRPEFDRLSKNAKIIFYDQRGCGKSEYAPSYTWQDHLLDLEQIIKHFSSETKVVLAGSSWGSILALLYTIYYPDDVKGLILSGVPKWRGHNVSKIELSYNTEPVYFISPFVDNPNFIINLDSIFFNDPQTTILIPINSLDEKELLAERYDTNFSKRFKNVNDTVRQCTFRSLHTAPNFDFLDAINTPTIIFRGDIDCGMTDWGIQVKQKTLNSQLVTIPSSCHDPWFIDPDQFFTKCLDFIAKLK